MNLRTVNLRSTRARRWLWASLAGLSFSACFVPRSEAPKANTCTHCHGDADRGADLRASAPPNDVWGNTSTAYPGVGAHQQHLRVGRIGFQAVCEDCHRVPKTPWDDGHNDGKTDVTFSARARGDGGLAAYDPATRTCTNSACHGPRSAAWTREVPRAELCGSCHGLPPPAPHPQQRACEACHADVVGSATELKPTNLHLDGVVQVSAARCDSCHGQGDAGAPPRSLDGGTSPTQRGVGAHTAHLSGGSISKPVPCATCHLVPERLATPRHPNGGLAEVSLTVDGGRYDVQATTCAVTCHSRFDGGASPAWTAPGPLACDGCHGAPPPAPHPPVANCALCHPNATGALGRQVMSREQHVDGVVQVQVPTACDGCHGSNAQAAPPRDAQGNTATSARGVGAHRSHVVGRGLARVVQCEECHVVPATTVAPGHLDGVAQVRFSGAVAFANFTVPRYDAATTTCANAACHDIANWTSAPGGGQHVRPVWTDVDGGQATCSSCHGNPPPLPHVQRADCEACHTNATAQRTFRRPELHVNGQVEFVVP